MRWCAAGLVTVLGLACGGREPAYRKAYAGLWDDVQRGVDAGECKVDARCGDLAFVNCRVEVDGPGYYVDVARGAVLEVCGGACMAPSEKYCVACPPPEWTCTP